MLPRLTDRGRTQAGAAAAVVAAAVSRSAGVRVWSSDLTRAVETAQIVRDTCGAGPVHCDERLREQHLGDLEGRPYEETWAAAEAHDWSDPTLPVAGGESPAQVHARMAEVLADAVRAAGTAPVVLVTHGDAIRAALAHLSGFDAGQGPWTDVPNGAVFRAGPDAEASGVTRIG